MKQFMKGLISKPVSLDSGNLASDCIGDITNLIIIENEMENFLTPPKNNNFHPLNKLFSSGGL